jgi:hypothetical protein
MGIHGFWPWVLSNFDVTNQVLAETIDSSHLTMTMKGNTRTQKKAMLCIRSSIEIDEY